MLCIMSKSALPRMVADPRSSGASFDKYRLPPAQTRTDKLSLSPDLAPMPRHVWFQPEPVRLVRQESATKARRGACTEHQLFPTQIIAKPTGLETGRDPCFSGALVPACYPVGRAQLRAARPAVWGTDKPLTDPPP